jgi:hypothetical protein
MEFLFIYIKTYSLQQQQQQQQKKNNSNGKRISPDSFDSKKFELE